MVDDTSWGSSQEMYGELMEDKGCFNKVCLCKLISMSSGKSHSPLLVQGWGGKTPSQRKIYALILGRYRKAENYQYLLIFNDLQLTVILMPRGHILGSIS